MQESFGVSMLASERIIRPWVDLNGIEWERYAVGEALESLQEDQVEEINLLEDYSSRLSAVIDAATAWPLSYDAVAAASNMEEYRARLAGMHDTRKKAAALSDELQAWNSLEEAKKVTTAALASTVAERKKIRDRRHPTRLSETPTVIAVTGK